MKVIVPIGKVPLNSVVTKKTGEKRYIVVDRFHVFDGNNKVQEIVAHESTRFIIPEIGGVNANALAADIEVVWHVEERQLIDYLLAEDCPL